MLTNRTVCSPTNKPAVQSILQAVESALTDAKLQLQFSEYRGSIVVDGKRMMTGRVTITLEIDGGCPLVTIDDQDISCCE